MANNQPNGHLYDLIEGQSDRLGRIESLFEQLIINTNGLNSIAPELAHVVDEIKMMRTELIKSATGIPRETVKDIIAQTNKQSLTTILTLCSLLTALVVWFTGAKYLIHNSLYDQGNPPTMATPFP